MEAVSLIVVGMCVVVPPIEITALGKKRQEDKAWREAKVIKIWGHPRQALVDLGNYKETYLLSDLVRFQSHLLNSDLKPKDKVS